MSAEFAFEARVKGLNKNGEMKFIVARLLEHARIFFFRAGKEDITNFRFFTGSADWMKRNLYSRAELVSPVYDKKAMKELWDLLNVLWKDESANWWLKRTVPIFALQKSHKHQFMTVCQKTLRRK